jgi:hypothetical protein
MTGINGKRLTDKEYHESYTDGLRFLIKQTFGTCKDVMAFITYQPTVKTYHPEIVSDFTKNLFRKYAYVEVIENTYQYNGKRNGSEYDGTYHSHIIMRLSDYQEVERKLGPGLGLKRRAIESKVVWGLKGLAEAYLPKQKGNTSMRDWPISHQPEVHKKEIQPQPTKISIRVNCTIAERLFKPTCVRVIILHHILVFAWILPEPLENANKIHRKNRFVDDT